MDLPTSLPPIIDIPSQPRPNNFESLPPELMTQVIDFLDPVSAASFAVSYKAVYIKLGSRCLKEIKASNHAQRLAFLMLWEMSSPAHILCHNCEKLYPIENSWRYGEKQDASGFQMRFVPSCWKDFMGSSAYCWLSSSVEPMHFYESVWDW